MISAIVLAVDPWPRGWTLEGVLVAVIVLAAVSAIVWVALKAFGINVPPWVMHIVWIVIVAFVAITAIRLVLSM